ncbi:MAG TPA: hypothetical protein VGY91_00030 [Chthoniobacterales bacterium]|jgi:hypothetical protein|nr:hypothetical protein [Chthoniobacterales bacterium]
MGIWNSIENLSVCEPLPLPAPYRRILLVRIQEDGTHWLVGPFRELTKVATDLRSVEKLCNILSHRDVRLGLREDDKPPLGLEQQASYGPDVRGANRDTNFTARRVNSVAIPFRANNPPTVNRVSDRRENVKAFWNTRTPQSHHIVEFNHLERLGVSNERGDLETDYDWLPAVLLAAEFHQRYLSAILKQTHRWDRQELQTRISATYESLYRSRSRLFLPLWEISKIILHEAGIKT